MGARGDLCAAEVVVMYMIMVSVSVSKISHMTRIWFLLFQSNLQSLTFLLSLSLVSFLWFIPRKIFSLGTHVILSVCHICVLAICQPNNKILM